MTAEEAAPRPGRGTLVKAPGRAMMVEEVITMRCLGVLCAGLLVVGACGGTGGGEVTPPMTASTTSSPADTTPSIAPATSRPGETTTIAPTTPTTAISTTTSAPAALAYAHSVLVVNPDGVFQVDRDGTIVHLVSGPVAYAVDDTQGGLLFQVDRGRDWEDFFGDPTPGWSTAVGWIPAGSSNPQALLVPTPGAGHALTLFDTFAVDDAFAVVYLRHEGEAPPFDGIMADTLRVYDAATQTVTELYRVGGWEWNLDEVNAAAGLVAATEAQMLGDGCRLFDATGRPASRSGVPTATQACFDESSDCPSECAMSADASLVA